MKNSIRLSFLVLGVSLFLFSCKKEGENLNTILNIPNATLREGSIPSSTGANQPVIDDVNHNDNFIAGGGCPIQIQSTTSSGDVAKVYLGLEGYSGYFEITQLTQSTIVSINPIINADVTVDEITVLISVEDENGSISSIYSFTINRIAVGTGVLQVSLTFDQNTDLDLYLVEPDGEVIFYGNRYSTNGGILDLDSNPGCWVDGVNNENITYDSESTIESGTYTVRVNNFADCVGTAVNYSVYVRYNGELVSTSGNANPYNGTFLAGTETPGWDQAGQVIFTFNVATTQPGTRTLSAGVASFK